MASARPNAHLPVFSSNSLETVDSPNIDDDDWCRKSQFQQWDQALPSGEHLRVVTMLSQQAEHLVQRPWRDVVECGWEHPKPPGVNPSSVEERPRDRMVD
jgi:hypothetical protein